MANEDTAEKLENLLGPFAVTAVTAAAVAAGWQNPANYPVELSIPAATAGTVAIAISVDGVTYTTIEAARAIAASGSPNISLRVPTGCYVKLTPTTTVLANGWYL